MTTHWTLNAGSITIGVGVLFGLFGLPFAPLAALAVCGGCTVLGMGLIVASTFPLPDKPEQEQIECWTEIEPESLLLTKQERRPVRRKAQRTQWRVVDEQPQSKVVRR